jgi:glycosyltransferase involved in cell wall biosynthesis
MLWIFWLSVVALVYTQFGYLTCLAVAARIMRRPVPRDSIRRRVSIVIPVHNGGLVIARSVSNLRPLDYPPERLEIIVVDDCSNDATPARVASACSSRLSEPDVADLRLAPALRLVCLHSRSGKAAALNAGLRVATGEIIGFADVAAMLEPDALAVAVERFADPKVGCVSSEDRIAARGGVGAGEGLYTRLDTLARRFESAICSATGANGSFYLVRRELCPQFPLDVATDMFSALYCVSRGFRAVVEDRSKVSLAAQPDARREFERKVRTMVTGLRALGMFRLLLNPFRYGVYSLFLASHKLARYLTPLFVLTALISTAYLSSHGAAFKWLLIGELEALCIGIAQISIQTLTARSGIAGVPAYACATIAAAATGWYRYLTGMRYETWQPTERSAV